MLRMIFGCIRTLNPLSLPFGASFLAVVDDFAYLGHLFELQHPVWSWAMLACI